MGCYLCKSSAEFADKVFAAIAADPDTKFDVDLDAQTFTIASTGDSTSFEISPYKKECLQNGYDDIDYLISLKDKIEAYEAARA